MNDSRPVESMRNTEAGFLRLKRTRVDSLLSLPLAFCFHKESIRDLFNRRKPASASHQLHWPSFMAFPVRTWLEIQKEVYVI